MWKETLSYLVVKSVLYPMRFLPHRFIHLWGKCLGYFLYYLLPSFRKRALSNLSLAKSLHLRDKELKKYAKQSFQNLVITCLEYPKLLYNPQLEKILICENPEKAQALIDKKQGVVFFCGHQSNWEVLFLEGSKRMPGIAIGRPIKNRFIYNWILSVRERFGGTMITPSHALKEGIKALRQGKFLGIVGDQGMPGSGFSCEFLGRKAWTSPAPALLACRTNSPIIVATTKRRKGKYYIKYSDPIWPDTRESFENQVDTMMTKALKIFEQSIVDSPGEWLWQHNRWKQETPKRVYYKYRYDTILIILPLEPREDLVGDIKTFKEIYPDAFLTIACSKKTKEDIGSFDAEYFIYEDPDDLYLTDYKQKIVFNFTEDKGLKKHYLKLSAFKVLSYHDLKKEAEYHGKLPSPASLSAILKQAVCRPGTLWKQQDAT